MHTLQYTIYSWIIKRICMNQVCGQTFANICMHFYENKYFLTPPSNIYIVKVYEYVYGSIIRIGEWSDLKNVHSR